MHLVRFNGTGRPQTSARRFPIYVLTKFIYARACFHVCVILCEVFMDINKYRNELLSDRSKYRKLAQDAYHRDDSELFFIYVDLLEKNSEKLDLIEEIIDDSLFGKECE